jgi:menaquinone-dependent protoporphyrinogen IX oxidase
LKIEYYHASKYGNGARVAEEFQKQMEARGVTVDIHHVKDVKAKEMPPADLYLFSASGRFGKPIGDMRGFLKKVSLPSGTKYAVLVTELAPDPEKAIRMPTTQEEIGKCHRVIPAIDEMAQKRGWVKVAEGKIFVTGIKGPLEPNWQREVEAFASRIPTSV